MTSGLMRSCNSRLSARAACGTAIGTAGIREWEMGSGDVRGKGQPPPCLSPAWFRGCHTSHSPSLGQIPPCGARPAHPWHRDTSIHPCRGSRGGRSSSCRAVPGLTPVGTRRGCPGASPAQETFPRWNLAPELPIHFNYKNQHPECPTQLFAVERWNYSIA